MNARSAFVVSLSLALILGACSSPDSASDTKSPESVSSDTKATGATAVAAGGFNDADVAFAQGMIPHHRQAVDMATIALDTARGAGPQVRDLAARIRGAQDPEITRMTGWLKEWGQPLDAMAGMDMKGMEDMAGTDMEGMEGMVSAEEMTALESASGPVFDKLWLEMMVRHHDGAVTMSKTLLAGGTSAAARKLAKGIISAQEAEIAEMKQRLATQ